ncbi:hypothetical protein NCCP691_39270 [Noviherbaspirillum aridicola]|uniref:Uncharacterized protein n=1 Tax=Noviherbaspirillum aridicola TaxID=2849687 RepID=A0ABQ4Q9M0_9BURK|nr:hypothetical protein NCCP691_39270 [Noviherbaspirillum aridicola]
MTRYTSVDTFLDTLATAIEAGDLRRANFASALISSEWARLVAELAESSKPVKQSQVQPFQFIGILPPEQSPGSFTYAQLSRGIKARLEQVAFAQEHIRGFLGPKH